MIVFPSAPSAELRADAAILTVVIRESSTIFPAFPNALVYFG